MSTPAAQVKDDLDRALAGAPMEDPPETDPTVGDKPTEAQGEISESELLGVIDKELGGTAPAEEAPKDEEAPKEDEPPKVEEPPKDEAPPKVEEPPKDEAPKRPSDQFGELPKDAKKETSERFESLRKGYDELHEQYESYKQQVTPMAQAISETGTNPEQFGATLTWLALMNSGKRDDLEAAYNILQNELAQIAKDLGKAAPGVDPLDSFPDLKKAVDSGELDKSHAEELASARAAKKYDESRNAKAAQDRQATEDFERQQKEGLSGLKVLGDRLKKSDPLFDLKLPMLKPAIEAVITSGSHPSRWVAAVEKAYKEIKVEAPKGSKVPDSIVQGGSPAGGTMNTEPQNEYEAVDMALKGIA